VECQEMRSDYSISLGRSHLARFGQTIVALYAEYHMKFRRKERLGSFL
jgi:hypothetical protein